MIYADQQWIGDHGIGGFARHVLADLDYRPLAGWASRRAAGCLASLARSAD